MPDTYDNSTVSSKPSSSSSSDGDFGINSVALYAILFVLGVLITVLTIYFLLNSLQTTTQFLDSRLRGALSLLTQETDKARIAAVNIVSEGISFMHTVWNDIDFVLTNLVNAFVNVTNTLAAGVMDILKIIGVNQTVFFHTINNAVSATFNNLLVPITDALANFINTVAAIICAIYNVFKPNCTS